MDLDSSGAGESMARLSPASGPDPGAESSDGQILPADSVIGHWVHRSPAVLRPFLILSRYDRPVGFWLLALPCWIGLALSALESGFAPNLITLAALFGLGAIAMRGAGCTYNDIVDRRLDAQVARTAGRPLASGAISLRAAWIWGFAQIGVGFCVWLALPRMGQLAALGAIPVVAAYPFMKRVTFFPQIFLGLAFASGTLIACLSASGTIIPATIALTLAIVAWVVGYDTIYALQDREDDARTGIKSTALKFGAQWRHHVHRIYLAAGSLAGLAAWLASGNMLCVLAASPFAVHLWLQPAQISEPDPESALRVFRSNVEAGLILAGGYLLAGGLQMFR